MQKDQLSPANKYNRFNVGSKKAIRIAIKYALTIIHNNSVYDRGRKVGKLSQQINIFNLLLISSWIVATVLLFCTMQFQKWNMSAGCLTGVVALFNFCKCIGRELFNYHRLQTGNTDTINPDLI